MAIIKPSTAFKSGADWVSADVRAYMIDQVAIHVDAVGDVNSNDFEKARWLFVKATGALYRLDLAATASDDGDTVLIDNIGRRYIKSTSVVRINWDASGTLAGRAAYDGAAKGFVYAVTDGADLVIYVKETATSGDWSNAFSWRGAAGNNGVQSSNATVTDIIKLTQAQYDALVPPNATTFYIVVP